MKFYKAPPGAGELMEIAAGPDGAMWFTSFQLGSAIGRVATH